MYSLRQTKQSSKTCHQCFVKHLWSHSAENTSQPNPEGFWSCPHPPTSAHSSVLPTTKGTSTPPHPTARAPAESPGSAASRKGWDGILLADRNESKWRMPGKATAEGSKEIRQ